MEGVGGLKTSKGCHLKADVLVFSVFFLFTGALNKVIPYAEISL